MSKICDKHNIEHIKSGNSTQCLECGRERSLKYSRAHTKERKEYRQSDAGKSSKNKYVKSHKGKATSQKYRENNKLKIKARKASELALRIGTLVRPATCSECGIQTKTEAHHHRGYEKSYQLDVVWLCRPCHALRSNYGRIHQKFPQQFQQ